MTRVTEQMIFSSLTSSVMRSQGRVLGAQRQAETGLKVEKPSDDPVHAARGTVLTTALERFERMSRASGRVELELGTADATLGQADGVMSRVRELAIQGANAPLTADERRAMAAEVRRLRESLLGMANTEVDGVYIFGGFRSDQPPFAADGSYAGDAGVRQVELLPGVQVDANKPGDALFGVAGGVDIFGLLDQVAIDLDANAPAAVAAHLGNLDAAQRQLVAGRTDLGNHQAKLESAEAQRDELALGFTEGKANAVEIDAAEAYIELLEAQRSMQAAIAQATRILSGLSSELSG